MKSIDITLSISCEEIARFCIAAVPIADFCHLARTVVVVIYCLVPSGLGEEHSVVVAVGGDHAVYGLGAAPAV